jgi:hypothetical protein
VLLLDLKHILNATERSHLGQELASAAATNPTSATLATDEE